MDVKEFIANLNKSNFSLSVDNGKLNLNGDRKKLSKEEIEGIKSNREVIDYIKANKDELIEYITLFSDLSSVKKSKNISSIYRLSGLQQGMLFHGLYEGETEAYKVQFKCDLIDLDEKAFITSWEYLLKRHTILRSGFYYDAFNVPVQCVYREVKFPVEVLDLRSMDEQERTAAIKKYEEDDLKKEFDFKTPPLMRVGLLRLSGSTYRMQWTSHHILFDGWSLQILMEEFLTTYDLLTSGRKVKTETEDKYEDYIRYIDRTNTNKQEAYWRNYLKGVEQSTLLPFLKTTVERTKGVGSYESVSLKTDQADTHKIQTFAQHHRLTVNTLVQGVWSWLLHSYTGSDDILFGVVVSGRPEDLPGVEQRVGMFVNTLPLHSRLQKDQEITEWLQNLQSGQILSRQYQHTPLSEIQQWTGIKGDLFDTLLVFENYPVSKMVKSNNWSLKIDNVSIHDPTNYPLTILINSSAEELSISFNYNARLLDSGYVQAIRNHFEHVLLQITDGITARLSDIKLLAPAEENMLLETFNDTKASYSINQTIVDLFEEQVVRTPGAAAIIFEEETFTYEALNSKVNQLAHFLMKGYHLKADDTVGVMLNRCSWSPVAMLAVMKTGACYVPIDPDLPESRLQYIISDAVPKVILSDEQISGKHAVLFSGDFLSLPQLNLEEYPKDNPVVKIDLADLSYIIYTSGSTGMPKGVMQTHRTLYNLISWVNGLPGFEKGMKLLQYSAFGFDFSLQDVYFSLSNGGSAYVLNEDIRLDFRSLASYICDHQIQILSLPFSALSSFFNSIDSSWLAGHHIKHIFSTGEQLVIGSKLEAFLKLHPHIRLHNFYGPSETHVVTACSFTGAKPFPRHIPIGKPVSNSSIYIVDKHHRPVPAGVTGEIYIGGDHLARGYLGNEALTSEKFVKHFFKEGALLYRSGDLGRWLADGNIEYLGRRDDQVKIRGYRIELGEIESILNEYEGVKQVVVLAKEDKGGNKRLIAYVVSEGDFNKEKITSWLKGQLPEYMVPSVWVEMEAMPLTANGKVDKRALPDADVTASVTKEYAAPRSEVEKKLAAIWQELLGLEHIGIHDNFFELGGHSLLAMRAVSAIRRSLAAELGIKDLFTYATIAELAAHLAKGEKGTLLPPIEAHPRPEQIPLSFSQERLWFIDRLEGSVSYHLPAVLRLKGTLVTAALEYALQEVINRHEVLRTVIREQEGQGYQRVLDKNSWKLFIEESAVYQENAERLKQYIENLIRVPFDLSKDHMLRGNLITLNEQEHILVLTMHHIASDGWSISILVKEVVELYESYIEKREAQLATIPIQYADYAIWQRHYLQGQVLNGKLDYWKEKLQGVVPLELPTDYSRPVVQSVNGAATAFSIDKELSEQLHQVSRQQDATVFMTLLAAYKVLLYRYSGQEDICVGTPIANRTQKEVEQLIGFFINTLALRSTVTGNTTFIELLQQLRTITLEAYDHQEVPFEKVVDAVAKGRDMSRSPLFQVMFVLQNTPEVPHLRLGNMELSSEGFLSTTSKFDLTFTINEMASGFHVLVQYNSDLYKAATIDRLITHFQELLHAIVKVPDQKIGVLPMLSKAEERSLLVDFNNTQIVYPNDITIIDVFEKQAQRSAEAVALVFGTKQLSYRELNERSNQLARYLQSCGVKEEVLVPICIEKSMDMMIGILGILKAGGAYVPVDPEYPLERISFMLEDTRAHIVIGGEKQLDKLSAVFEKEKIVTLNKQWITIASYPVDDLHTNIKGEQLAYVLYTSGSTGKPKGVQVQHHSFINHLQWFNDQYEIGDEDSSLLLSSFSFDGGMTAMWPVLTKGGTLHLPESTLFDPSAVLNYIYDKSITYLKTLPGILKALIQADAFEKENICTSLRLIIVGGERVDVTDFKNYIHKYPHILFANHYGPTECTISSSFFLINSYNVNELSERQIIGKPVANTSIYITGDEGQLNPIGVIGEISIGGTQVARGYLNLPELTSAKFITDPFAKDPGSRLYKTGDLGRWLPDGNLEYLGRKDSQVKIRGYRIELGEIESILNGSEGVSQAVVLAKGDTEGNKRLVGYIVADETLDKEALVLWLKGKLPEYMVPLTWVKLEALPLTPNGKIDKRALPEPDGTAMITRQYVAPRNEVEEKLSKVWQALLNIERAGIYDNFFELGGHSLLAMRVLSLIRKNLHVEIVIKDLFIYPTIAELAVYVSAQNGGAVLPKIEIQVRPEHIPLSFSQERLWFMDQLHGSVQYHLPAVLKLTGRLRVDGLRHALQEIMNRHEVLRTVILENEGKGYQYVLEENGLPLSLVDGAKYENDQEGLQTYIREFINTPFDLSKDRMMRAELVKLRNDEHLLVMTMHHIASDKWSTSVFVKEVVELYDSYIQERPSALVPLTLQYADYAIWQRNYLKGEILDKKLDYWKEKLKGIEHLELPADYPRSPVQGNKGTTTVFNIDKQLAEQLKVLSQQQESTLFMTLLAAFKILLQRYSGQQDICVGTSIAGRQLHEIESLIGLFVNILALRTQVNNSETFTALLQQVKQTTLEAYEHQEVPFEKVVDAVVQERDMSRSPVFQVMLVMLNTPEVVKVELEGLTLSGVGYNYTSSKYDITFFLTETPESIIGSVEYNTELFSEETIQRMVAHFNALLHSIVSDPRQTISGLPMLSKAEENQLLTGFNDTAFAYPDTASLVTLFEAQVLRTPAATAIVFEAERFTYQQLNERANQVANHLLQKGIRPGANIGLFSNRCTEMIVAMLGIVKAGCAYVPINTEYPVERINYIIEDAAIEHIVYTNNELLQSTGLQKLTPIHVADAAGYSASSPVLDIPFDACAYIMFTSGTTGRPKGIAVSHRNIIKLVHDNGPIRVLPEDCVLQWSNYSFDGSVYDIYSSLLRGASLCLIRDHQVSDADELARVIHLQSITVCFITTALFNTFIDVQVTSLKGLRKILFGGEMVSAFHVKKALSILGPGKIVHVYGPTETTVYASSYSVNTIETGTGIPIGKPLSNSQFYVIDKGRHLVPVGVPGELYIGGHGVSLGYVNNEALTKEKFIPNPFTNNIQDKLYQTGDIVRWLEDGNIEYLGRKDEQVKIRGFRIELGEIESVLQESEVVRHAAVMARVDGEGTKRLVGYIVPNGPFDKQLIRQHLKDKLPEYMIPGILLEMEELPLNANGKIDRRALPDPDAGDLNTNEFVAPSNHHEQVLASIWQNLLDLDQIGVHDNFFEIGGDSLLAIRVISAIRKELEIEIPISSLFEYQTIASLAAQIDTTESKAVILPPIVPAIRPDKIPLSFSQQRLWFIDKLEGSIQYHIPAVMRLKGDLNIQALTYALNNIINRHEVLRTVFLEQDGHAWQSIKEKADWELRVTDFTSIQYNTSDLQILIQRFISAPFDLSKDNMLRADVVSLNEKENLLIITIHHIASDGWSRSILVKEVAELYASFEEGRQPVLPAIPVQYADFSIWQRNYLYGEVLDRKLSYWMQKLQGVEPIQLPSDFSRPAIQTTRGSSAVFTFDKKVLVALQQISQQNGSTLFMVLLTSLKILLYRYTRSEDICVGTGIAGRRQQEVEGLIGFFVNTLALRTIVYPDHSFIELLQQVKATTLEAYEHQDVPFEKVVDAVITNRDRSRSPIFQIMFVLQNTPDVPNLEMGKLQFANERYEHTTSQFDLSFSLIEHADGLAGSLVYNADLYSDETISRLLGHFDNLVQSVIQEPGKKVIELSMLSEAEKRQLMIDFNNTAMACQKDKSVVYLFEEQVANTPDAIAVVFEEERISYLELNGRSNQLAHYLRSKGVKEETIVPICIDRSVDMIVGILGILKAGGAYLPIDPNYPQDRISYMLEDTGATLVLSSTGNRSNIRPTEEMEIIELDGDRAAISEQASTNPENKTQSDGLAYVIYTSGSMGKPKGVMIEHTSLVNLVQWHIKEYNVTASSKATAMAGVGFDAFGWEIWPYLSAGASVYVISDEKRLFAAQLFGLFTTNGITHSFISTALVTAFIDASRYKTGTLQYLLTGGDKLPLINTGGIDYTFINNYGPTENTVVATNYAVTEKDVIPAIGKPIANTHIYIVDRYNGLVGIGVSGEICIGGAGLARAYLNQPELTAEKFITDPFSTKAGARLYKTGDLGRWLSDGNIQYLGRMDEQVKIHGYRIELGEIEHVLQESGLVKQVVILTKEDAMGTRRLIAYIVAEGTFDKQAAREYLEHKLPAYMVPALWMELDSLPLTPNGKIDRKALPDPDAGALLTNQYVAPRNETESKLAEIWQELLHVDKVGIHDNFFELGGHSILVMRLISLIHKEMKVELAVKDIFQSTTISELSKYLEVQISLNPQQKNADEFELLVI